MKRIIFLHLILILFVFDVKASPLKLNYQGRILKNDSTPLTFSEVKFRFEVVADSNSSCILYRETVDNVDLSVSMGTFDVNFGDNPSFISSGSSNILNVFENSSSLVCENTSSYTPSLNSMRYLRVSFWDGVSWQILNQNLSINSVPYSLVAKKALNADNSKDSEKLGGVQSSMYLLKPGSACASGVTGFDGTSLTCVPFSSLSVDWSSVVGKPTTFAPSAHTHVVDEITSASGKYFTYLPNNVACANNEVLKWNGTGWICGTDNSGVGSAITDLTGDVSASGSGSVAATVNNVGGKTAAQIATAVNDINNASATYLAKAGGTMSGAINMNGQNITNTSYITMNASATLHLSNNVTAPTGLIAADKGKMWFNSASNRIEYWDGAAVKVVSEGTSASDLTSITGTGLVVRNGASSYSTAGVTAPLAMVAGNLVLNNTAVTAGTYGSATQVGTFTVDAQGRLTSASNVTITPAWGSITGTPTTLSGYGITDALSSTLADGKILVGNATNVATPVTVSGDATLSNVGVITLSNSGATAGTYTKVTVDAKGRVTSAANIASSDITTALGFTPLNKAGDVMTGLLGLNGVTADPAGLTGADKGKLWFRTDTNEVKYWNGSAAIALGVSGAGLTSLNGQTGSTQTFAVGTTGTAPAYSSGSNTHTLNIPMASATGVTAGLLSKTDYDAFNAKLGTASTFSGDVSGTSSTMSVDKIKGSPISLTAPANGQFLKYNGANWINSALSVNLTADVTGTLPVANGGTGATSLGSGNLLVGSGTGAVTSLNSGLAGNVVYSTGASSWASGTADTAGLVDKSSTQTISGAKAFGSYLQMNAQNEIRFADADSSNYVSIRAPSSVAPNITLTLPATAGSNGQVLTTDGAGGLSWSTPSGGGGGSPTGSAGGDLAGSYPNPILANVGTAGTYTKITTDSKGRVTSGQNIGILDVRSSVAGAWFNVSGLCSAGQMLMYSAATDSVTCQNYALTSAQITTALGFTPAQEGGSVTQDRIDMLRDIQVSDAINKYLVLMNGWVDPFVDASLTSSYTGAVVDPGLGFTNQGSGASVIPALTSTLTSGSVTVSGSAGWNSLWMTFDSTRTAATRGGYITATGSPWIKVDFGSGNQKYIVSMILGSYTGYSDRTPKNFVIEGSNDDTNWVSLLNQTNVTWANGEIKTIPLTTFGYYRYYRLTMTSHNGGGFYELSNMELIESSGLGAMTITSNSQTADYTPGVVSGYMLVRSASAIVANTDVMMDLSRDNGGTWTTCSLSLIKTFPNADKMFACNDVNIAGQPTGASMRYRIRTSAVMMSIGVASLVWNP